MWHVFHEPWGWLDHHFTVQSQDMSWGTTMTDEVHPWPSWPIVFVGETHISVAEPSPVWCLNPHVCCWRIPFWCVFFWLRVNPNFTYSNFWIQAAWTTNMFLGHIPIPNEVKRCTPQKDPLTWRIIPRIVSGYETYLVGGLAHEFYFPPIVGNNNPIWLSDFSEGLKPPTRYVCFIHWWWSVGGFAQPCLASAVGRARHKQIFWLVDAIYSDLMRRGSQGFNMIQLRKRWSTMGQNLFSTFFYHIWGE